MGEPRKSAAMYIEREKKFLPGLVPWAMAREKIFQLEGCNLGVSVGGKRRTHLV